MDSFGTLLSLTVSERRKAVYSFSCMPDYQQMFYSFISWSSLTRKTL